MKLKIHVVVLAALLLLFIPWCSARGGGRGGGGRGRGRSGHSGYIQRGNPNWKPNPSADAKAFEWAKVGRLIKRVFGGGDPKPGNVKPANKGYQGKYVPKNIYHPKKPKPIMTMDRINEEDGHHRIVTPSPTKLV